MNQQNQTSCNYHPKQQPTWFCSGCKTYFCNECNSSNQNYPKCILCRRSLTSLSIAEKIPPFKQKMATFFMLPLKLMPLALLLFFSFLLSLLPFNKIGLILLMVILIPIIEFMFDSMEQVASGEKLKINSAAYWSFENTSLFLKLLGISFMLVFVLTKIHLTSALFANLIGLFFVIGLPASLVILMMEKSMLAMINPIKIGFVIKQFFAAYWFVFCWLVCIVWLNYSFHPVINYEVNQFTQSWLVNFMTLYACLSLFLMMGYLVFQYHFELNYKINHQTLSHTEQSTKTNPMAEVEIFIQEGRFEDAQTLLLDKVNKNPLDYKANEKLIFLYSIQDKNYFLNMITQKYFNTLVDANKNKHAADFYCELQKREIIFIPDTIKIILAISKEMQNSQQFKYAIELIKTSLKQESFPAMWEEFYLIYAKLLAEFANDPLSAKEILNTVIEKSKDKNKQDNAKAYRELIKCSI